MEEYSVQARAATKTVFLIPRERRSIIALIVREGFHIVRDIGQMQDVFADDVFGGAETKTAGIPFGWDDGELFHNVKCQVIALYFLPGDVVQSESVQISQE